MKRKGRNKGMANNKKTRELLEEKYGHICMLHEGLKINGYSRSKINYKGKSIEQQLTLHHIRPKSKGGETSIENGAVLCRGCHDFLERTTKENRERINNLLKKYKECVVEYGDDFTINLDISAVELEIINREKEAKKEKYNRAKEKEQIRKEIREIE